VAVRNQQAISGEKTMYRKLLATTAFSLIVAGGAYAQDTLQPAPADPLTEAPAVEAPPADPLITAAERGISANGWLASEIIGERIYNSTAEDAETIGEVNDFVLDHNGEIGAIIVGVGGFLGIGQKNVAVSWEDLELVIDANGDQRLVASVTREQLEAAAEFDRAEWLASESARQDAMMDDQAAPMEPAAPMAPAEPAAPAEEVEPADPEVPGNDLNEDAAAPADDDDAAADTTEAPAEEPVTEEPMAEVTGVVPAWDTFQAVEIGEISVDELTGTTVYGADDENIGSIGDVILSDSGEVEAVIIDFGGFLGIGTKPVAVGFENLTFLRDENGDLVLRTNLTREQLDAAPEYNADAYLAAPGENVIVVE
jgi:sporulation protein YlmC with PRC-barrel domain